MYLLLMGLFSLVMGHGGSSEGNVPKTVTMGICSSAACSVDSGELIFKHSEILLDGLPYIVEVFLPEKSANGHQGLSPIPC